MSEFKLGVCTWTFGDLPLPEIAAKVAALALDGVELMGDLSRYSAVEAKQILSDQGLRIFSLTPDNVDLSHPDADVRSDAVDYYYRLLDFAAALGNPLVSCHGMVGRVAALATRAEEDGWLETAVRAIATRAQGMGLRLVFEVLNRYETHQVRTGVEVLAFVAQVGAENVGGLLDAYHMNIEEPDPAAAIRQVGNRLWLYHAADSNREAVGRGHTDFAAQVAALQEIGYTGPVIFECTAPGPNPFTPIKDVHSREWLERYLTESRDWFRRN